METIRPPLAAGVLPHRGKLLTSQHVPAPDLHKPAQHHASSVNRRRLSVGHSHPGLRALLTSGPASLASTKEAPARTPSPLAGPLVTLITSHPATRARRSVAIGCGPAHPSARCQAAAEPDSGVGGGNLTNRTVIAIPMPNSTPH